MTYDFAPLFRTAIGFDRLARLADTASQAPAGSAYPPYNIEKLEGDRYRLTLAVAGFAEDELELVARDNTLVITGKPAETRPAGELIHRGIAGRGFERRFVLADHITVEGADLSRGLLHVELRRVVPEALKPRRIEIAAAGPRALATGTELPPASNEASGTAAQAA